MPERPATGLKENQGQPAPYTSTREQSVIGKETRTISGPDGKPLMNLQAPEGREEAPLDVNAPRIRGVLGAIRERTAGVPPDGQGAASTPSPDTK